MKKHYKFSFSRRQGSLLLIFGLALLGQFSRIGSPVGRVSLHEIVMLPVVLITLWQSRQSLWQDFKSSRALQLALLFVLWTACTTLWNAYSLQLPALQAEGLAYLARLGLYLLFAYVIQLWRKDRQIEENFLWNVLFLWLLLQACIGLGQFLLLPDTRIFSYLGWDDHLSRAFGTLFDPGFFGLLMALGALLSFSRAAQSSSQRRLIMTISLALFLSTLALSYSRASYVAFLSATVALSVLWKQRKVFLLIPLLVLCLVLLPKDGGGEGQNLLRTRSIEAREEVLEYHSQNLTLQVLLVGRGWYYESALSLHESALAQRNTEKRNSSTFRNNAQAVDNVYAHVLLSTGIIGSTLFAAWLGVIFWQQRRSPEFLTIWTAVLVHSLFSTALLYSWVMLVLVMVRVNDERHL